MGNVNKLRVSSVSLQRVDLETVPLSTYMLSRSWARASVALRRRMPIFARPRSAFPNPARLFGLSSEGARLIGSEPDRDHLQDNSALLQRAYCALQDNLDLGYALIAYEGRLC